MHDSERLPIEQHLRPAPGVPIELLRGQVETAQALQAAIIDRVAEEDSICTYNFAQALSVKIDGIRTMSETGGRGVDDGVRQAIRQEVTAAIEDIADQLAGLESP